MQPHSLRAPVVLLVLACLGAPATADAGESLVYWTDSSLETITRADLDGSGVETVVASGLDYPEGIVVLADAGEIWWADGGLGAILKSDLDGQFVETVIDGLSVPAGLAIDPAAGKVYWSNVATGPIHRANLDGTEVELVVSPFGHVRNLAIDPLGGKLYFTGDDNAKLQRANLDGTDVEDLATGANPTGVALDPMAGKVYWSDDAGIQRANVDGSSAEVIVPSGAFGLAIDTVDRRIYWTHGVSPYVRRAELDGSNVEGLVFEGAQTPRALALLLRSATNAPVSLGAHSSVALAAPRPNPAQAATLLVWGAEGPSTLRVLDVAGRIVRSWSSTAPSGTRRWDGRSATGEFVASGVYLVELRSESGVATRKVVVTR